MAKAKGTIPSSFRLSMGVLSYFSGGDVSFRECIFSLAIEPLAKCAYINVS